MRNKILMLDSQPTTTPPSDIWRPVVGYEGIYSVSDRGGIRRDGRSRGARPGRIRKLTPHPEGYLAVTLWRDNIREDFLVHQVVAAAFIGPCPIGHEVNHKNRIKTANWPANLEYVTGPANIEHGLRNGVSSVGEANSQAKLTELMVHEIRAAYSAREGGYKRLGKRFGVTWEAIRQVVKKQSWGHI
jgi:hypothetical protein